MTNTTVIILDRYTTDEAREDIENLGIDWGLFEGMSPEDFAELIYDGIDTESMSEIYQDALIAAARKREDILSR